MIRRLHSSVIKGNISIPEAEHLLRSLGGIRGSPGIFRRYVLLSMLGKFPHFLPHLEICLAYLRYEKNYWRPPDSSIVL